MFTYIPRPPKPPGRLGFFKTSTWEQSIHTPDSLGFPFQLEQKDHVKLSAVMLFDEFNPPWFNPITALPQLNEILSEGASKKSNSKKMSLDTVMYLFCTLRQLFFNQMLLTEGPRVTRILGPGKSRVWWNSEPTFGIPLLAHYTIVRSSTM